MSFEQHFQREHIIQNSVSASSAKWSRVPFRVTNVEE